MNCLIGIISYLPNNEVRTKRLEASRFQIEFMHNLLPNTQIMVVAQAYDESEYIDEDYIEYIKYDKGIGAGQARNVILKKFYNSNYDILFLCDDDTIWWDRYGANAFLIDFFEDLTKFQYIDAVSAVEPEYHPYKKLNYQDKGNLTHYKFEPRELNSGSATSLIKNIKKLYGKEIYYPDTDANKGEGREDIEFLLEWLKQGLTWYTMQTWIRKSLCFDKSSIFGTDTKARDKLLMHDLDVVCDKYKEDGLQRQVNGKITWSAFNERYNKSEKLLYIPRKVCLDKYNDDEIPIKKSLTKSLF